MYVNEEKKRICERGSRFKLKIEKENYWIFSLSSVAADIRDEDVLFLEKIKMCAFCKQAHLSSQEEWDYLKWKKAIKMRKHGARKNKF